MAIRYKIDVLAALKAAGYNTTRLGKEKLLSPNVVQYLRSGKMISMDSLDKICDMLHMQPGDILFHTDSTQMD
jgi:putative transcriptional regulator